MKETIEKLIKKEINPELDKHFGGCELVKLEDGIAHIKLLGGCTTCPGKKHTFEKNITPFMMENVEGLKGVKLA